MPDEVLKATEETIIESYKTQLMLGISSDTRLDDEAKKLFYSIIEEHHTEHYQRYY